MVEETLPDTADDDGPDSIVLHVDIDYFHVACECLRKPELEGEPVVAGMGYEPDEDHGMVVTVSYEARELGVDSAQPISMALEHLPRIDDLGPGDDPAAAGHCRTVDLEFYRSVAASVKAILHDCADVIREVSIDETYLGMTGRTAWDPVTSGDRTLAGGFARYVKQRITHEVGVTAPIGVVPNMSTTKTASDFDKPDRLAVVRPSEVRLFLAPISVKEIHDIGPVTVRKLGSLGIKTAGDLAGADAAVLEAELGSRGRELHERARGYDNRAITPTDRPKSLPRESASTNPTDDIKDKQEVVRAPAADVADRARFRGAMYQTVGIKVVIPSFNINTRATLLSGFVDDPELVESIVLNLLDAEFAETTVRKLGVRVSRPSFVDADQSSLDSWEPAEADETGGDGNGRVDDEPPNTGGGAPSRGGQSSLVEFD